jgi:UDP-N-acetylglucosamine 3-dehydrogenase
VNKKHKVAVVGLGVMGLRHVRVLLALEKRFELVGTYDVRSDGPTPAVAERFGSEAEALARAEVVVVATPIASHADIARRALAAGKHVLVEKPLCATSDEARTVIASARAAARLFVGHSERFNPVVRALANLLRGDDVRAIDFERLGPSKPCGHGVLVNVGVHDLDLAAYLAGGGVVVRGAAGSRGTDSVGEDFADVVFATAGGAVGRLALDRTSPLRRRSVEITTSQWLYEGDLLAHRLVRTARGKGAPRTASPLPLPADEPLMAQAIALADALDGRTVRDLATGLDGLRAVELAERAAAFCAASPAAAPVAEKLSLDVAR